MSGRKCKDADEKQARLREASDSHRAAELARFDFVCCLNELEALKRLRVVEAVASALATLSEHYSAAEAATRAIDTNGILGTVTSEQQQSDAEWRAGWGGSSASEELGGAELAIGEGGGGEEDVEGGEGRASGDGKEGRDESERKESERKEGNGTKEIKTLGGRWGGRRMQLEALLVVVGPTDGNLGGAGAQGEMKEGQANEDTTTAEAAAAAAAAAAASWAAGTPEIPASVRAPTPCLGGIVKQGYLYKRTSNRMLTQVNSARVVLCNVWCICLTGGLCC
jgi:hypothetical protein